MILWLFFCQKMLSHDLPVAVACRGCQSPLPFAFASQCCQSMLPVAIRCCCSFLWVLVFYIWWSKHFNRSMGRETWGRKHGTDNEAFFLLVFCQKNFYWEWSLLSKEFLLRWDSEAFFSGCLLSEIFRWRRNSVEFFSCCLLLTWGWEHWDGTVWQFISSFLFTITHNLHIVVSSIFYMWGWKHVVRSLGTGAWGWEHGGGSMEMGQWGFFSGFDMTMLSSWNCHFLVVCFPTHFFLSYKLMITIYLFLYIIWFLILVDFLIHRTHFWIN